MIAVVIPSYKVKRHIMGVIGSIPPIVNRIYVVDDCCPELSGKYVQANNTDSRVRVLFHEVNQGVGGATATGYMAAYAESMEIIIKVDGDGQMDAALIPSFIEPILKGQADYTKGNRFYDPRYLSTMPAIRLFGNLVLSFVSKLSSGYWDVMDPTNGYTALHCRIIPLLSLERVEKRYFFESDMLYRLGIAQAVVRDVPMRPFYADEVSSLSITKTALEFPRKHLSRFIRRIGYNYFVRDFNIGSLELIVALVLLSFGIGYGSYHWYQSVYNLKVATSGTVMLSGLPVILGFQSLLASIQYDILRTPKLAIHPRMAFLESKAEIPISNLSEPQVYAAQTRAL
jgi:dolichol-phosphate mannosyltransferase